MGSQKVQGNIYQETISISVPLIAYKIYLFIFGHNYLQAAMLDYE
jgi:hypothetical protein